MKGDRWVSAWACALAAFLLGFAIQLKYGTLTPGGILLLTLALPLAAIAVLRPAWRITPRHVRLAIGACLAVQIGLLLVWPPGSDPIFLQPGQQLVFRVVIGGLGLIALAEVVDLPLLRALRLPAVLVGYAAVGAWVIASAPLPANDAWWFQREGAQALLEGVSPFGISMPNIYGDDSAYYAPGLSQDGRLAFGLPYPPLSLLLSMPGYLLAGDVRNAHLAATVLAALLMAKTRAGPIAAGAAMLFLFTPRGFFVLEQGWTEPQVVLGLALVTFLAARGARIFPLVLGLVLAVKQYLLLLLPLAALLQRTARGRWTLPATAGLAVLVAAIVTLPFAVWNWPGFYRSLVELQFLQPFRDDALSYLAWFELGEVPGIAVVGFALLVPAGALIAWRAARTPAGFATAAGFAYLMLFAFNKQAFANYYYFVIGALCCAVAATQPGDPDSVT